MCKLNISAYTYVGIFYCDVKILDTQFFINRDWCILVSFFMLRLMRGGGQIVQYHRPLTDIPYLYYEHCFYNIYKLESNLNLNRSQQSSAKIRIFLNQTHSSSSLQPLYFRCHQAAITRWKDCQYIRYIRQVVAFCTGTRNGTGVLHYENLHHIV